MAPLTCPVCGAEVQPGDLICLECGANLARRETPRPTPATGHPAPGAGPAAVGSAPAGAASGQSAPGPPVPASPEATGESTATFTPFCPHCGADVPDLGNAVCVECLRPLRQQPARSAPLLRLAFSVGEFQVASGAELILGRDPVQSPVSAALAEYDNVSRRHATVGMDGAGRAWVRDDRSTNGTYVNGQRVPADHAVPLTDGDSLRLGADATAEIHLTPP